MSLPRIRDEYRHPAYLGAVVGYPYLNEPGTITGCDGDNLLVTFHNGPTLRIHPDAVTYYRNGRAL